ncbi:MAG: hypothetical protein ABW221_10470 [Vicinamibacteria bacterium]
MTLRLLTAAPAAYGPHAADQQLLARVMEEQAVARALPEPSWMEYLWHVLRTAIEAVLDPLMSRLGGLPVGSIARALAIAFAGAVVLLAVALAVRLLRRRARADAPAGVPAPAVLPADAGTRPAEDWHAALEARLAGGDVAGALEALWWWLAASVAREPVDGSWTTRELLARAGRPDLRAFSVGLDRLAYAAARPRADEVRAFFDRLRAAL